MLINCCVETLERLPSGSLDAIETKGTAATMTLSLTLSAAPANDNNARCEGCNAPAGRNGLCAACEADVSAHIDAMRFYPADDEGLARLAGFDVSDSLRFI